MDHTQSPTCITSPCLGSLVIPGSHSSCQARSMLPLVASHSPPILPSPLTRDQGTPGRLRKKRKKERKEKTFLFSQKKKLCVFFKLQILSLTLFCLVLNQPFQVGGLSVITHLEDRLVRLQEIKGHAPNCWKSLRQRRSPQRNENCVRGWTCQLSWFDHSEMYLWIRHHVVPPKHR